MNVFKKIKQRGQILLLYALLIPMLFFFVGITFDLSWYYINISRMQNAADAAVIAGAQKLIEREESLSDYNYTTFVNGFNSNEAYELSRGTFRGDNIAKTYVEKNLAKENSSWENNKILDLFTRKNLHFTSNLLGDNGDNFEVLYYHVMLEQEVPHMMLGNFFSNMNAKVSAVAKITQFMKGYDLFNQMKHLAKKQTYSNGIELYQEKISKESVDARSAFLSEVKLVSKNNFYTLLTETANFPSNAENFQNDEAYPYPFDNLFVGYNPAASSSGDSIGSNLSLQTYREININTVYAVRDYAFYSGNNSALEMIRNENVDYEDLADDELATVLARDSFDPLYVRIESEKSGVSARQIIINVNVANMDESTERPIILFYDGPLYDDESSLPVILNLNADFRGVLYAPNNPVVINGNGHKLQGFVVAKNFTRLEDSGEKLVDNYSEFVCAAHYNEKHNNQMYVNESDEVQYKKNLDGSYQTVENFALSTFSLRESEFDSLNLVGFENYVVADTLNAANNLFTAGHAETIK